jgi:murein DD-endopeptidase MepM/ murein hydrolase activator NlpD
MQRWAIHRTRSKVALLLLINLVTLLGGKYTVLITIFKIELFGEAMALAKTPKKKPPRSHIGRAPGPHLPPQTSLGQPAPLADADGAQGFLVRVVRRGETLAQIADAYGTRAEVLQGVNGLGDPDHLLAGQELRIPTIAILDRPEAAQTHRASDRALDSGGQWPLEPPTPELAQGEFIWPVEGTLTSLFGTRDHMMGGGSAQFHAGIDIAVPAGTPVQAAQEGIVVFAGYHGAYGKAVKLDHANGYATLYAHNARLLVHVGQAIKAGQVICVSGSTGRSTGPHVHFEVHKDGWPVDPLSYLP